MAPPFGNAGIIQHDAVVPYGFPCSPDKLLSVLLRHGADIRYHASALPGWRLHLRATGGTPLWSGTV